MWILFNYLETMHMSRQQSEQKFTITTLEVDGYFDSMQYAEPTHHSREGSLLVGVKVLQQSDASNEMKSEVCWFSLLLNFNANNIAW